MNFGVVNENSTELRKMTDTLLSLYPGGVVYEYTKPNEILIQIRSGILNAVFLELKAKNTQGPELVRKIRSINANIPVVVSAEDDSLLEETMWNGASSFFVKPLLPEQIKSALNI